MQTENKYDWGYLSTLPMATLLPTEKFLAVAFAMAGGKIGAPVHTGNIQKSWPQHMLSSGHSPKFYPTAEHKKWVLRDPGRPGALVVTQKGLDRLNELRQGSAPQQALSHGGTSFVDIARLAELRALPIGKYDLARFLRICEEVNDNFSRGNYISTILLVRVLLDHVPPIFGFSTFAEVANNYGSKSTKASLQHLENSSRKIADGNLHTAIRLNEVLPTPTQVNFSQDLDVLLGEIVRILK